jgi:hypothetical protein
MTDFLKGSVRKSRVHRRRARVALAVCAIAFVGLALVAIVGGPQPAPRETQSAASSSEADGVLPSEFAAALPPRAVYRHSVIDGGAYTPAELAEAIHRDPVVADHYRAINVQQLRSETATTDQLAYMSYRRGDQIYWTKHKVRLRQGETILTDGRTQVRSRCGNCISLEPMQPTAEDEPDIVEFDALTSDPAVVATLPSSPYLLTPPPGLLLPPPFGTAPFDLPGPIAVGPIADDVIAFARDELVDPDNPGELRDLGDPGFDPPGPPFPLPPAIPGHLPDPDDPSDPGVPPLVNIPPFDPPIDVPPDFGPEKEIPESPVDPVPVPEPGTLLLIGGGGLGLVLRRLRSRN